MVREKPTGRAAPDGSAIVGRGRELEGPGPDGRLPGHAGCISKGRRIDSLFSVPTPGNAFARMNPADMVPRGPVDGMQPGHTGFVPKAARFVLDDALLGP